MSLAEQVYQTIKPLPEAMVQEVLDFALFWASVKKTLNGKISRKPKPVRLQTGIMPRMRFGIMYQASDVVLLPFLFNDADQTFVRFRWVADGF